MWSRVVTGLAHLLRGGVGRNAEKSGETPAPSTPAVYIL
jgi:hypothetical protein